MLEEERKKHQDQDWPQESAHIAEKEKQGGHVVCTPHTLLHFILPNTLDHGTIILILLTRSQDWEILSSKIFLLQARHSVKYFLWIIFSNTHNYLSLAPWSPFYKETTGERQNHLPSHTHLIRGASETWTQAGPSHPNSGLFTQGCFTNWSREGCGSPWPQVSGFLSDPTLPRKKDMSAAQKKESQSRMDLGTGRWDTRQHWLRDFPSGSVVKTTHFHCRERRFGPLLGN